MNNKIKLILRIFLTLLVISIDVFLLIRFDYIKNLLAIDNFLGILPLFLMILFTVSTGLLIWKKYTKDNKVIAFIMIGWTVVSVSLFPLSLTKNWFFSKLEINSTEDAQIEPYRPFMEGTKAVKLDEPSTLTIDSDMPKLDGALALYPVYSAIAQTIYNEANYTNEVMFQNTIRGFKALVDGTVDIFFSAKPSDEQYQYAKDHGKEIKLTEIGLEAFVFLVAKSNPIDNLTIQQIKNIYSGKTDYWRTLGWNEGGKILKYQRPKSSGSQTLLEHIMGDLPIEKPQPAPSDDLMQSQSLMEQMSVPYNGVQSGLGYSFKFYATTMKYNPDVKLLSINGVSPTPENITSFAYPYSTKFYAMTIGEPEGNIKKVIDWILSSQGQKLIEKSGYSKLHK